MQCWLICKQNSHWYAPSNPVRTLPGHIPLWNCTAGAHKNRMVPLWLRCFSFLFTLQDTFMLRM
ncbi:unnamed protein product, partial [Gulo gulo]